MAAKLLLSKGHEVESVYVRTWEHEDDILGGDCPGAKDLQDAEEISKILKIRFEVVNFVDFYKKRSSSSYGQRICGRNYP